MDSSELHLTESQEKLLNLLPIPSAFISILGSSAIIYLAYQRRKVQRWTPYTRLLVAMSIFDILFSINIASGTYLRPKETSTRQWAYGNETTCNYVAFMNQFSWSGMWYQGMLSIYFLLTARFGMKNDQIAKCVEPMMHFVALGFNIGAGVYSLITGVYGEKMGGAHCWVARIYKSDGALETERKKHDMLIMLLYPLPMALVTICLIGTQLSIFFFVRRHTRENGVSTESSLTNHSTSDSANRDTSLGWSERTTFQSKPKDADRPISRVSSTSTTSSPRRKAAKKRAVSRQNQRLRLVCSQAFLFVASFLVCNIWNIIMATQQSKASTREEEMAVVVRLYPVAVIQAILIPIQGLFNCLIFIRPKYLMIRYEFPNETKLWTVKRIFLGEKLKPTKPKTDEHIGIAVEQQQGFGQNEDEPVGDTNNAKSSTTRPRGRNMMSSVTASDGDFDSVVDAIGEDERWQETSKEGHQSASGDFASNSYQLSMLEAIGELSESEHETVPTQTTKTQTSISAAGENVTGTATEGPWSAEGTGDETIQPSVADSTIETPNDPSAQLKAKSLDGLIEADVPVSKQSPETLIDSSRTATTTNSTLDLSAVHSDSLLAPKSGPKVRRPSDVPLVLPERFDSLPQSEVEDC